MVYVIIGIILTLIGVCRLLFPNVVSFEMLHLDIYGVSIALLGLGFIFFRKIKNGLQKVFKKRIAFHSQVLKTVIIALCLLIIILKFFNSALTLDNTSLYLIITIFLVLIVPDLKDFIFRLKRFKKGDWELEFNEELLDEIKEKVTESVKEIQNDADSQNDLDKFNKRLSFYDSLLPYYESPKILLPLVFVEIDRTITKLAVEAGMQLFNSNGKYYTHGSRLKYLLGKEIIDNDLKANIHNFYFGFHHNSSREAVLETINLGFDIMEKLFEL